VALVGHGAAGKTTLAEQLPGQVRDDRRGWRRRTRDDRFRLRPAGKEHPALAALVGPALRSHGTRIHLIDTPGYPDFLGQAIGALDAVETVAVVVSATNGIELVTRRMMAWAKARNLCRMIIVNKIDHEHINLPVLLEQLQEAFGAGSAPDQPAGRRGDRVIDCF